MFKLKCFIKMSALVGGVASFFLLLLYLTISRPNSCNKIKDIALSNTDYLERSINSFYNSGTDGIVLSWDLMRMPLEHLDIYIKLWNKNKL